MPAASASRSGCRRAVVAVCWSGAANLYNFMDGSDGLAGAMGVCGFGAYGIAARHGRQRRRPPTSRWRRRRSPFLVVNLPPARMFMGDVGAVPMGFLAAAFGLAGWRAGTWPAGSRCSSSCRSSPTRRVTLAKRLCRRERVWEAHKDALLPAPASTGRRTSRNALALFGALMAGTVGVRAGDARGRSGVRLGRARGVERRAWRRFSSALIIIGGTAHRTSR